MKCGDQWYFLNGAGGVGFVLEQEGGSVQVIAFGECFFYVLWSVSSC